MRRGGGHHRSYVTRIDGPFVCPVLCFRSVSFYTFFWVGDLAVLKRGARIGVPAVLPLLCFRGVFCYAFFSGWGAGSYEARLMETYGKYVLLKAQLGPY